MADASWKAMFDSIWKLKGNSFIQFLLDAGLDVNAFNKYGKTMLSYAAEWGNLKMAEFLVQEGADGSIPNSTGSIPLHIAAKHGRKEIVKFFLDNGTSADSCDVQLKDTSLHYIAKSAITSVSAVRESYHEIVLLLIHSGADLDAVNRMGETPLLLAAHNLNKPMSEMFIKVGADANCYDRDHWTMLHHASWNGWSGIVRFLVEWKYDIDLNARTSDGNTPLLHAASNEHKDTVRLLIKLGANVDCRDDKQTTMLHHSSSNGWLDIVKYLVDTGFDLNAMDCYGHTPLLLAASRQCRSVVEYLIESGANLDDYDEYGNSVLHYACCSEWLDVVKSIIKKGSDINPPDNRGDTPLHFAVRGLDTEIIRHLLQAGADWNLGNSNGITAFHECIQILHYEWIVLFVENGAYFQSFDYRVITFLKEFILRDSKICTQAFINRFNSVDLPKMYKVPIAKRLPPIEKLRIASHRDVAQDIEDCVKYKIRTKGYCNLLYVRPIVLSILCVRSLVRFYKK